MWRWVFVSFFAAVTCLHPAVLQEDLEGLVGRDEAEPQAATKIKYPKCSDPQVYERKYVRAGEKCDLTKNIWCVNAGWAVSGEHLYCLPDSDGNNYCRASLTQPKGSSCLWSNTCAKGLYCARKEGDTYGTCQAKKTDGTCDWTVAGFNNGGDWWDYQCGDGQWCLTDNRCHTVVDIGKSCKVGFWDGIKNQPPDPTNGWGQGSNVCLGVCIGGVCSRLPNGKNCTHDWFCQSHTCMNVSSTQKQCKDAPKLGESCNKTSECQTESMVVMPWQCSGKKGNKKCVQPWSQKAGNESTRTWACQDGLIVDPDSQTCQDPSSVYCDSDAMCTGNKDPNGKPTSAAACNCRTRRCYLTFSGSGQDPVCQQTYSAIWSFQQKANWTDWVNLWRHKYGLGDYTDLSQHYQLDTQHVCSCRMPGISLEDTKNACKKKTCNKDAAKKCLGQFFSSGALYSKDMCIQGRTLMSCWKGSGCTEYYGGAFNMIKNNCFKKSVGGSN
eukprot:TRINITY_DN94353_c0_g1_i1.p1 TRINITY_DN94353_c0_g1~~TRINITY_DN94353_c0_g1_i1.p1  ORF type:complete len:495 (+),score=27.53 TRINITY_DN94353_c0_g1_i1:28-1512(+)